MLQYMISAMEINFYKNSESNSWKRECKWKFLLQYNEVRWKIRAILNFSFNPNKITFKLLDFKLLPYSDVQLYNHEIHLQRNSNYEI